MILKAFSVRDQKTELFNTPFWQKSHGEAERNFSTLVRDEKSTIAQYPEDYDLYYIGDYDDAKGLLIPLDTPQHVMKAIQAVKQHNVALQQ